MSLGHADGLELGAVLELAIGKVLGDVLWEALGDALGCVDSKEKAVPTA